MDGLEERRSVFVIAATNRPDIIDPAMLRPGRLDKLLYVPLPTKEDRNSILKTHLREKPLSPDVMVRQISSDPALEGFSGADIAMLVREASVMAIQRVRDNDEDPVISMKDFTDAMKKVFPSVS
jgi:ribosome biogenesis ATPase